MENDVIAVLAALIAFCLLPVAFLLKRRLYPRLLRKLEENRYRSPAPAPNEAAPPVLIISTATMMAMTFVVAVADLKSRESVLSYLWIVLSTFSIASVLVIVAMSMHYVRRGKRRLKYDLLFTAVALFMGGYLTDVASAALSPSRAAICAVLVGIGWILVQTGAKALAARIARRNHHYELFFRLQSPALLILTSLVCLPLLFVCAVLRFYLLPHVAEHPILYLRSFRDASVPYAYGHIVAKVATRFGVLEGLVSAAQRASDLQRFGDPDVMQQGNFTIVPDEQWQDWVIATLRRAAVVIVDASLGTQNVLWEVDRAVELLGLERIAVIVAADRASPFVHPLWTCQYSSDLQGVENCRRSLETWLREQLWC